MHVCPFQILIFVHTLITLLLSFPEATDLYEPGEQHEQ